MTVDRSQNSQRWSETHPEGTRLNYLQNHLPRRIALRPEARYGDGIHDIYILNKARVVPVGKWGWSGRNPPPQEPSLTGALSSTGCSVRRKCSLGLPEAPSPGISISGETFPTLGRNPVRTPRKFSDVRTEAMVLAGQPAADRTYFKQSKVFI